MTRRVGPSNAAADDLISAIEVYRKTADAETADAETAARFIDAVPQCTRRIAIFPSTGSLRVEVLTGIPGLRSLAVEKFPYQILSTADDDVVRVHRVLRARRDVEGDFVD